MKSVFEILLWLVVIIGAIGSVILWFFGVPYLGTLVTDFDYTFLLSIWLTIHLIRSIYGRIKAQKQLEQYLGGK